jgi:AcrR family transcriptional regulator
MARSSETDVSKRILAEAIRMVYREGPNRVTMRALAEKLGYSVATIYLYFRSKEDLLLEIALHGFDALAEAVEPAAAIEDPRQAVSEASRRYIRFGLEKPELYRLMFQDLEVSSFAKLSSERRDRYLRAWDVNRELYRRGIERGVFRASTPEVEATIGWAWVHGFVQLASAQRLPLGGPVPVDLRAASDAIIEGRLRALCP